MLYVQYANSLNFQNLLYGGVNSAGQFAGLNSYLNIYWQDFYDQIFNIDTATEEGLNLWGEILNTGRQYYLPTDQQTFGFDVNPHSLTGYAQNFDHGSFYAGGVYQILQPDLYRCLLILRAQYFISNGSILSITKILNDFFANLVHYTGDAVQYDIAVSVSTDLTIPYKVNYVFKHINTASTTLPVWFTSLFITGISNYNYLPIPIGGYPHIQII